METLVLDGKTFVRASKAARDLGYTSDYVGQLCRSGQVSAHLVGRTWYVDQTELSGHRVEKKRMSRVKAREQAKKSIEEHARLRSEQARVGTVPRSVSLRYENDESELIPQVRKLAIDSEPTAPIAVAKKAHTGPTVKEPAYEILNPGEKIVMSGKLTLVDLNEENIIDRETTHLTARINRKKISKATAERAIAPLINNELYSPESPEEEQLDGVKILDTEESVGEKKNFLARLNEYEVETGELDAAIEPIQSEASEDITESTEVELLSHATQNRNLKTKGPLSVFFGIILPLMLILGSIVLQRDWVYTNTINGDTTSEKLFSIDYTDLIKFIRSKI